MEGEKIGKSVAGSNAVEDKMRKMGWEISGPFYTSVPTPKKEYLEIKQAEEIATTSELIDALNQYLLRTLIIKDGFGRDHSARRRFEAKNQDIWIFNSEYSKLGIGKISGVLASMNALIVRIGSLYPSKKEELEKIADLKSLYKIFKEEYPEKEFEDRVILVKKFEDIVYKFLLALSS